ncbi:MAG: hypothetical protein ACYDEQ_01750 [Desulfocucumaceae bacterium]
MNIDQAYEMIMPTRIISYLAMGMWMCVISSYFITLFSKKYIKPNVIHNIFPHYDDFYKRLGKLINKFTEIIIFISLFIYLINSFGYKKYSFLLILFLHGCILPFYLFVILLIRWLDIVAGKE